MTPESGIVQSGPPTVDFYLVNVRTLLRQLLHKLGRTVHRALTQFGSQLVLVGGRLSRFCGGLALGGTAMRHELRVGFAEVVEEECPVISILARPLRELRVLF